MKLSQLKVGQRAKVVRVKSSQELSRRLRAMGLIKEEVITVEKVAPLGDPIEIRVKGTKLSLRKKEAENVEVEVI
ncbi:ferrous iron transport protein A [Thermovibrio guaymasensis]|uniref:Ferrous iron transport protein A n=1 Tax=Thermovibrio guaymasensis TaxID=240167 RepID=A0A420W6Z7_9BACT|nr:FeoA family protein [Thermovibrio guaymasensis]RKQ61855.1 ferrous iron transport protein A [Thermovibrio guaymasensis]